MLDLGQGDLPPQPAIEIAVAEEGALSQIVAEQPQSPVRHRLVFDERAQLDAVITGADFVDPVIESARIVMEGRAMRKFFSGQS